MTPEEIEARRQAIVAEHGPWSSNNIDLGDGVFTMGRDWRGPAEARVSRVEQIVCDLAGAGGRLDGFRVLDLGCYEGGFAVALARRGADVLGVEAREGHVAKARFAAEALGLGGLELRPQDVRELRAEEIGEFDVVLCLGILYHLPGPAVAALANLVGQVCRRLALVETQIALRARTRIEAGGRSYAGLLAPEEPQYPGAAVDAEPSFWPTRASLVNLLADAGFTAVHECLSPLVPEVSAYRDHVLLLATTGDAVAEGPAWPERARLTASPPQGWRYRLRERIARRRGRGLQRIFARPD